MGVTFSHMPIYIGQGTDRHKSAIRWKDHIKEARKLMEGEKMHGSNMRKLNAIISVLEDGSQPQHQIIRSNMDSRSADILEDQLIRQIGRVEDGGPLTNLAGFRSKIYQDKPKTISTPPAPALCTEGDELVSALMLFAYEVPSRVTIRQLLVFIEIARENRKGNNITVAEIRAKAGSDCNGDELLGQSIGRSYQVFCEPTKREPENLGWVETRSNEDDRRQKFLYLTPKGKEISDRLFGAGDRTRTCTAITATGT